MRSLGFRAMQAGVVAVAMTATAGSAHHSTAMFDQTKTVVITGTVRTWQWTNPHAWLWIVVPNRNGQAGNYGIELGALSMLRRGGLSKDSFTPGQKVSVSVHPLLNGENGGMFVSAEADGKVIKPMRPQ